MNVCARTRVVPVKVTDVVGRGVDPAARYASSMFANVDAKLVVVNDLLAYVLRPTPGQQPAGHA